MMPEAIVERYRRWDVEGLLRSYPDLRIVPTGDESLKVRGPLAFRVRGPSGEVLEDGYEVELRIPASFPSEPALAFETGGRIPRDFHKLVDGSLCLAAPVELKLKFGPKSTLVEFLERFVIPYLFGFSHLERHGSLPFGELEHGKEGLRQHLSALFGVSDRKAGLEFLRLSSLKGRPANKEPCPCGSGRRLGRCHHRTVNELRQKLGRKWLASEYASLETKKSDPAAHAKKLSPRARPRRRRPNWRSVRLRPA